MQKLAPKAPVSTVLTSADVYHCEGFSFAVRVGQKPLPYVTAGNVEETLAYFDGWNAKRQICNHLDDQGYLVFVILP